MDTNNKDEMIEEMEDVSSTNNTVNQNVDQNNEEITEVETQPTETTDTQSEPEMMEYPDTNAITDEEIKAYKKSKVPVIVLLSILLALDIIALILYLIGLDKVFSFIK